MSAGVFALVIASALCHAGWNALIKLKMDPFWSIVLINAASGLVGLIALPFTGLPGLDSAPYLALSLVLHLGYYTTLIFSYRHGDMGVVYPVARGAGALLIAGVSVVVFGQSLPLGALIGISVLAGGIVLLAQKRKPSEPQNAESSGRAVLYALATALTICGYTLSDGAGARASGNAFGYAAALFVINVVPLTLFAFWRHGVVGFAALRPHWRKGLAGGGMSFASYAIAIYAMSVAPIPLVAATREVSVLFAALLAVFVLREPLRLNRMLGALLVVAGLITMRLA